MLQLYSLPEITIIPTRVSDIRSRKECSPECNGLTGETGYLPIITAPMDSVVDENNYKEYIKNGISPVLPRTVPLEIRTKLCAEVFCAFGMAEIEEEFIKKDSEHENLYILIDIANGHMKAQLDLGKKLRGKYWNKLHLMGGNVALPATVFDYEESGFDYVRIGIGGGQGCITSTQCGIHYPMASLIMNTREILAGKKIKIIADGGIRTYSDIIKCLALGADYVMMGYSLSKSLEASGELYTETGRKISDKKEALELFEVGQGIYKEYHGMSTKTAQAKILGVCLEENRRNLKTSEGRIEKIRVEYTLGGWSENFRSYLTSAMSYTGNRTLESFIGSPRWGLISQTTVNLLNK